MEFRRGERLCHGREGYGERKTESAGEGPNCRSGGRPVFIARRAAGVVPGLAVAVPVARSAAVVAAVAGLAAALLLGPPGGG
jgi:hypothetical protein